jgi:hypothetical protein
MSQRDDTGRKAFQANAAIAANLLVKIDTAARDVAVAAATDDYAIVGSSEYGVADNEQIEIALRNKPGTHLLTASGAISVHAEFQADDNGKIAAVGTTATELCQGRTLEAATADGDVIECILYPGVISRDYSG